MHGGDIVAEVLKAQGTSFLFTLCGGHISPILVACKARGIRVVDTRHEATAVFAADAVARLTGRPGVAAVTAGPGITNTITAVKNAQMAQSPVLLIGGAAPTALQGRGALQDIDQMAIMAPLVKQAIAVRRVRELAPALERALYAAQEGVPGPVFVECPVDLLYEESYVRALYGAGRSGRSLGDKAIKFYLKRHVDDMFAGAGTLPPVKAVHVHAPAVDSRRVQQAAERLKMAERPVLVVGSQAMLGAVPPAQLAAAVERLALPVYLSGMARGLLGRDHPLQLRHKRREALREADCVLLAGVPNDFRLDYGNHIRRSAFYIGANRSRRELALNRKPNLAVLGDPARFLAQLAELRPADDRWAGWRSQLRARDEARNVEIEQQAHEATALVNPLHLCRQIDAALAPDSIVIGDGGDFVATAAYVIQPYGPLRWLDPGAFGTLGVGAGFALGARLVHPEAEVWILYGDGSVGYSLSEYDTFVRHGLPVIGLVGNDAGWSQIAREQVAMLHDDVGTVLARTDYDRVAAGFGADGLRVEDPELVAETLAQAKAAAGAGRPVLVNVQLGKTNFRKGSISL
jgi:acetolactate synthase-1/2/3 large subunit